MRTMRIRHPASLENLRPETLEEPPAPGPGEIKVRICAVSLNFRDGLVATGFFPAVVDRMFALERLGEAFVNLKAGGHFGKIVVEI